MKRFSLLSFVLFFMSVAQVNAQCVSSGTSGSTYIDQVYFPEPGNGTANMNTSGNNGYEDFSSLGSRREFVYFNQSVENKFGIGINLPSAGIDYFYKVWIDFDQDDDFESGELIWQGFGTSTGAETIIDEAAFNIIGSSVSGETTIRFILKEGSAVTDACETGFTGEVEDYTITLPPPSVSVDNVDKSILNPGDDIEVDYSVVLGNLNAGNTLTVQLSDASGDFSSPTDIGTLVTSSNLGSITATVPLATPEGTGYRVRVNSSDPVSVGDIGATNIEVTNDDISQTELAPGDIVIVCVNGDGQDGFGFITLVDLKEGTEIYFKDAGWESDDQWWNNNNTTREGMVTFTTPAGATAGSFFGYSKDNLSAPWTGSNPITNLGSGTNGDQIIAYQGTFLDPIMIYAVNKSVFPGDGWDASATNDKTSAVPKGLVDGVTAVGLKRFDNYAYTGATVSGSASELLAAVSDKTNWTGHGSQIQTCPSGFTVIQSSVLEAEISVNTPAACNGGLSGELTVSVTSGVAPFNYSWSNGVSTTASSDTFNTVTGLAAGNYTVTVTDGNGGSVDVDATITEPTAISVSIVSSSDVSCNGGTNGTASATASGGTGTLVYSWTGSLSGASVSGLSGGLNTVSVTDDNLCGPATADVTINEPSAISVSIASSSNISCNGLSDGEATASATGGTGTLVYSWTDGLSGASVSGLSAGVKTVSVTDDNLCGPATADVTITDPDAIFVSITGLSAITCNGLSDGTATASALGGTGNLTYTWTGGFTGASVTGLSAGPKTVSVTDDNSCGPFTANVIIHEPSVISASITGSSDVSCHGLTDGAATASGSGGTGNLVYSWTGGGSGASVNNLAPGLNTVSVTDANGCTPATDDVTISEPDEISVSITGSTDITCNGASTGTASATASGGTGTLDYSWTGGGSGASVSGLSAGVNTVSVTDDNSCGPYTADVTINEPTAISVSISNSSDISCHGLSDGEASATATGGTGTLTYTWTGGLSGASVSGLSSGVKTVSVTDDNLCGPVTADVTIKEPLVISVSISSSSDVTCNGLDDGSAIANGSGGTGTLVYSWTGGLSGASVAGLSAGLKTVSVTDENGCTPATDDVTINEPTALSVSISGSTDVSCNGESDGTASVIATGGTGTLVYSWTGGLTGSSVSGLSAGLKTVSVTDDNSCGPITADVTINEPNAINVSISSSTDISCNGLTDGAATASATGGTGTLVYSWTGGLTGASVSGLTSGVKTVSVTDDNSCTPVTADVTITEPDVLTISSISGTDPGCSNDDGTATVVVEGGTGTYLFAWSNGGAAASITGLSGGSYSVSVDDANSCGPVVSTNVVLTEPAMVTSNAGPDQLLVDQFTTNLEGVDDVNGIGEWKQITGTVSTIDDDSNSGTQVSDLSLGISDFVWTITGACNVAHDTVRIDVTTVTDVAKPELTSIHVYPNPAADFVTIQGLSGDVNSIELVDLTGQTIIETSATRLDLSNLPEGVYFIQVNGSEGTVTKRIVKRN